LAETTSNRRTWFRGSRRQVLALCVLALFFGAVIPVGCAHYEPTVPMRSRSADVTLELATVTPIGPSEQIAYRAHSESAHAIRHAWITVASRQPCTGGAAATGVVVDGRPSVDGWLPPGDHELAVRLEPNPADFALDLVVDVETDDGHCLRAPAVSQSIPLAPRRRPFAIATLEVGGNSQLSGLISIYGVKVGVGGWLGPVLASAEAGIGGSNCDGDLCGRHSDGSVNSGLAIPAALSARVSPFSTRKNRLVSMAFVGARYAFTSVSLPTTMDGDRRFATHAFQGVLSWALADGVPGPFTHPERAPFFEFAFPLGVIWAPGAPGDKVAFAAAMELRFLLPM
jgi:hypothetical protein